MAEADQLQSAVCAIEQIVSSFKPRSWSQPGYNRLVNQSRQIPRTSEERLQESLTDQPIDLARFRNDEIKKEKTYLYLGYGSNMCALSFLERRNIKPLSQINVVAPSIQLSFDLPGIAYREPCFGNVRPRDTTTTVDTHHNLNMNEKSNSPTSTPPPYHKNNWHKGLVGIVYEVTATDFAHIIATEGGGASYKDILVDCHALTTDASDPVPLNPTTPALKVHTLFSPGSSSSSNNNNDSTSLRPDPSYAQPSARYLKLLNDGGAEHDLPTEYRAYLAQIRPYTASTFRQKIGGWLFLATWGPLILFLFMGIAKLFIRPDGTYPAWYARLVLAVYRGMWKSYDVWFKPTYGDGERTIGDDGAVQDGNGDRKANVREWRGGSRDENEKRPLLSKTRNNKQEWHEPGTGRGEEMV